MLLESLASKLQCEHVVVHAPVLFAQQVQSVRPGTESSRIDALVRHLLWPMARTGGESRVLNRVRLKRGKPLLPFRILQYPMYNGSVLAGLVVAVRDSEQPRFEAHDLEILAAEVPALQAVLEDRIESGTGLLRRAEFDLELALRPKNWVAACAIYANLDQMHAINEIHGFATGDAVIREVGRVWSQLAQTHGGIATHLSGDRFVAVLYGPTLNQASHWAESARNQIEALRFCDGHARVTVSLGAATLLARDSFDPALAAAETACRMAKERGRNRVEVYDADDNTMIRRRGEVRASQAFLDAIEGDHYVLHAQKIVPLILGARPVHYEVLLRIRNSEGALVSIADYLPAAERYQRLECLDRSVVRRTLQALAPHAGALLEQRRSFAINLTGHSLSQPQFADFVRAEFRRNAIPPGVVDFEITETAAVRNLTATRRFIDRVRDVGARVALDDFGTGLSSLVLLKELDVQRIKIDGRFIRDLLDNPCSQALVAGLQQIAGMLHLDTVAEFVETIPVADYLTNLGITFAQGHLYGRAEPLSDVLEGSSWTQAAQLTLAT